MSDKDSAQVLKKRSLVFYSILILLGGVYLAQFIPSKEEVIKVGSFQVCKDYLISRLKDPSSLIINDVLGHRKGLDEEEALFVYKKTKFIEGEDIPDYLKSIVERDYLNNRIYYNYSMLVNYTARNGLGGANRSDVLCEFFIIPERDDIYLTRITIGDEKVDLDSVFWLSISDKLNILLALEYNTWYLRFQALLTKFGLVELAGFS